MQMQYSCSNSSEKHLAAGSSEGYRMVLARDGSLEGGTISAAATGAVEGLGGAVVGLGGAVVGLGGAAEGRAPVALRVLSRSPLGVYIGIGSGSDFFGSEGVLLVLSRVLGRGGAGAVSRSRVLPTL